MIERLNPENYAKSLGETVICVLLGSPVPAKIWVRVQVSPDRQRFGA